MKIKDRIEQVQQLEKRGFNYEEADQLHRIAMTFHRWDELECGDGNDHASWSIERDETTDKPFRCVYPHTSNEVRRYPIPDREKGAQRRLDRIMVKHPDFVSYHQSDPRGASLYIIRKSDLNGSDVSANYTQGIALV